MDFPDPDGPMIAVNRAPAELDRDAVKRAYLGLAPTIDLHASTVCAAATKSAVGRGMTGVVMGASRILMRRWSSHQGPADRPLSDRVQRPTIRATSTGVPRSSWA